MHHELAEHLAYVSDAHRLERFDSALREIVRAGQTVLDLGSGTGMLGLLALRAGAARVIAVDEGRMIEVARETFRAAGLADRVQFVRGRSQRVTLAQRADVALCDHLGYFGLDYGIGELLSDARTRHLKPEAAIVPRSVRLEAAAVAVVPDDARIDWDGVPADLRWLRQPWLDTRHPVKLDAGDLAGAASEVGSVDLGAAVADTFSWTVRLEVERDTVVQGIAGWFDAELSPGVRMTNSPLSAQRIDRPQAFLPIEPTAVSAGRHLRATITMRPADELIAWDVEAPEGGAHHRRSTAFAAALSGQRRSAAARGWARKPPSTRSMRTPSSLRSRWPETAKLAASVNLPSPESPRKGTASPSTSMQLAWTTSLLRAARIEGRTWLSYVWRHDSRRALSRGAQPTRSRSAETSKSASPEKRNR